MAKRYSGSSSEELELIVDDPSIDSDSDVKNEQNNDSALDGNIELSLYKLLQECVTNYGPKVVAGVILGAANVPRFFSGEKAAGELFNTDDEYIRYVVGGACWVANTVLGVYGLYNVLKMYRDGKLKIDPLFLLLIIATAASDVFNGIVLSSNPITKSGTLWAKLYTYASAAVVFGTSFCVNIYSLWDSYALLFHRNKEDIMDAEAFKSLSYFLIGRDEEHLIGFKNKIASFLDVETYQYQGNFSSQKSEPLPLLGVNSNMYSEAQNGKLEISSLDVKIAEEVALLTAKRRKFFIDELRMLHIPMQSTRTYEFLWFMKGFSISLAIPAAIALFYGPYDLVLKTAEKFSGTVSMGAKIGAYVAGVCPIPVKTAVYYKLLQGLFFKLCHVKDTARNFLFIQTKNGSYFPAVKTFLAASAFTAFSAWIFTSGVGFDFSVRDFCGLIFNKYNHIFHPDTFSYSDGMSDGFDEASFSEKFIEAIYAWWGTLDACGINLSSVLAMIEVISQSYLSQGYNSLSYLFNAQGNAIGSQMPEKTPTQHLMDSAENGVSSCVSRGSDMGDEENQLHRNSKAANESTPLQASQWNAESSSSRHSFFSSSSSSSFSFFGPLGRCVGNIVRPLSCCSNSW